MSDISNVLRKVIELDISLGLDGTQEALDEITRLTAEVEKLNSELTDALTDLATARQDNASFMPILNRLTAENEKLGRDYQSARDAHDKVLAENEKLRAANTIILEAAKELVQNQCEGYCTDWPLGAYDPEMDIDCSVCKLRAALSGDKHE